MTKLSLFLMTSALAAGAAVAQAQKVPPLAGASPGGLTFVPVGSDTTRSVPPTLGTVQTRPAVSGHGAAIGQITRPDFAPGGRQVGDVVRNLPPKPVVGSYPAAPLHGSYYTSAYASYPASFSYQPYGYTLPVYAPSATTYYYPTYYQSVTGQTTARPVVTSSYYPVMTRPEPLQTNLPPSEMQAAQIAPISETIHQETVTTEEVVEETQQADTGMQFEPTIEK